MASTYLHKASSAITTAIICLQHEEQTVEMQLVIKTLECQLNFVNDLILSPKPVQREQLSQFACELTAFISSRKYTHDVGGLIGDDSLNGEEGYVYRNTYYILKNRTRGPEWNLLILGNQQHESNTLVELEHKLFVWVKEECE